MQEGAPVSEMFQPEYLAARISPEQRAAQVLRVAEELYARNTDWVTFFKAVFGVDGIVARLFPTTRREFEQTEAFAHLQRMLMLLRQKKEVKEQETEPIRMITVRLPASLHEALRAEAHSRHTSINKLCITKLLQVIDSTTVPEDGRTAID